MDYTKLKALLLEASDSQLDARMKPYIEKWDEPPQALQVLEVLDYCIHGSLTSAFTVKLLQIILDLRLKAEHTTLDHILPGATWRT